MVFDATIPVSPQEVESYGIMLAIHNIEDFGSEGDKLSLVNFALEDGILDTLAVVEAEFCNAPKAAGASESGSGDIIRDQDLHEGYFTRNGG